MVRPGPGAVCDTCLLACPARLQGKQWKFKCSHATRRYAEEQRLLGYPDDFRLEAERLAAWLRADGR